MFNANKITQEEVAAAIAAPTNLAIERIRSDAETAHGRGYHTYARILTDLATRIEKAQSDAIDEVVDNA